MYKVIAILFFLLSLNIFAQTNVEMLSHYNPYPSIGYSNIWGYVDSLGNEYALLGTRHGTSIISLTDPENPVEVAFVPAPQSIWRELKVHNHYAYISTDQSGNGLQIIDLSQLPDTAFLANNLTTYFNNSHDLLIDNGFCYVVGGDFGGGMSILDLANPVNPVRTAYYTASGYIHDIYIWNDTVVASCGGSQNYQLVDVTDKYNPFKISESAVIPGIYAHSGWMTEDKRYFYATEEFNVRDLMVWDLQDRNSWELIIPSWEMPGGATIHNLYIIGDYAHISYYNDGYVVLDVSAPEVPFLVGHYDTENAWGVYPFLPSGITLISDIQTGLYVLQFTPGEVPPTINHSGTPDVFNNDPVVANAQIVDNGEIVEANLFYRTTFNGTTSDWNLVIGPHQNNNYEFTIPGFEHLTHIEYYIAALDDFGSVATLPEGGSGTGPAGNIPPSQFFDYSVAITGPPVLHSFSPLGDTTVVVNSEFDIIVNAEDTTGLELNYYWKRNGIITNETTSTYHYRAFQIPSPPRTDTIEVDISNGYFSVSKKWVISIQPLTNIKNYETVLSFNLEQNYPNPFNPSTRITFSIPKSEFTNLSVYNMIGEKVAELVNENLSAGKYNVIFNGDKLTSGIYLARIKAGGFNKLIKMVLMK